MDHSPYKFLDYYDFDDQDIYFGREKEINILVADVIVNRLVVLFARTGTGKTSLINAGVRPRLEKEDYETFYIRVEQDPAQATRDSMLDFLETKSERLKDPEKARDLKEQLQGKKKHESLSTQLCLLVESLDKLVVLFLDQFEEFFLHIKDSKKRQEFIKDISELYRNVDSGVHLVFSMREEYYYRMDEFREEIPSIFHKNSNLRLLPLDEGQARDAIINPAAARHVQIDGNLAEAIVKDLQRHEEGMRAPSLQIICDTLWRREDPEDRHITLQDYEDLGRGQSILDKRLAEDLEKALADAPELQTLMQRLIPELKTDENTKYPRLISDLVNKLETTKEKLEDLVSRLGGVGILKEIGDNVIEWASDYLAERTRKLQELVEGIEIRRLWEDATRASRDLSAATVDQGRKVYDLTDEELSAIYLSVETLNKISEHIEYIPSQGLAETVILLFDAALFHQQHVRRWFGQAAKQRQYDPYEILRLKIVDNRNHIDLGTGAIELLAQLKTERAIDLMGEALDKPDLALEAIRFLVEIPGDRTTELLTRALQRDDLWRQVVQDLERVGTTRSVALLEPLLQDEEKAFQVIDTLDRLAKSERTQTSKAAKDLLARAVTKFEQGRAADHQAPFAKDVLRRLAASADGQAQSLAKQALNDWEGAIETKREAKAVGQPRVAEPVGESQVLRKIITLRNISKIIPVISNSYRLGQIFQSPLGFSDQLSQSDTGDDFSIKEQLTRRWAAEVQYPLADDHDLARVAQYQQVQHDGSDVAKESYLEFLSSYLLDMNTEKPGYEDVVQSMRKERSSLRFPDVVHGLGYPEFPDGVEDPLRTLASLSLPVYVTTSYHDFLERELIAIGKSPRSQVVFWEESREYDDARQFYPDPTLMPTPAQPAVYHLFGLENFPGSLVLSEDDHMRFLISVASDIDTQKPIVVPKLRQALTSSHLLFLGYDWLDWEFRTLFRFVLNYRRGESAKQGIFVHSQQGDRNTRSENHLKEYLQHYFNLKRFEIEWKTTDGFIQELWSIWKDQQS
jgi:hypothetical protein